MKIFVALLVIAAMAFQYRLWIGEGSIAHVVRLHKSAAKQEAENDRLKTRNALLSAEVASLKTGTDGIEARARTQMGMIKEGETFFLIVNESER